MDTILAIMPGMPRTLLVLGLSALGFTAACKGSSTEPVVCTGQYVYAVGVQVKDSVTLAPAAGGAKLLVVDPATGYRDSTSYPAGSQWDEWALTAAGEQAGIFTIVVSKPGYKDWIRTNVVVKKNDCHVEPVAFTALLQK